MPMCRVSSFVVALPLILSASTGVHTQEPPALSPQEIAERTSSAVVMIEARTDGETHLGSGFLVADEGAIVTNLHVVDGATELTVSFLDGTRLTDVAVRAFDVRRDLAVLVIDLPGHLAKLSRIEFGDTSLIEPGAEILVIGNPMGLEKTVTQGIVSAWRNPGERSSREPGTGKPTGLPLPPCRILQISAALSPGSSGGPVLNDRAEVIGVATAGVWHGVAGLNFAVPVDELHALLDDDEAMDLMTFVERVDDIRLEMARPYFEDAQTLYEREEIQEAIDELELALQLFPRYPGALLLSGRIAMEAGQGELAEQQLELAVKVDEDNAEAWYLFGRLHHLMSVSRDDAALASRAEAEFEKALELEFRHAGAAFHLAMIQANRGLLERAEELLLVAAESDPDLLDAHYALGEIYLARGMIEDAKDAFNQALWIDSDHALSHFGLAKLYTEMELTASGTASQHGRGPHHWEEFLRLSEDDPTLVKYREIAIRIVRQYLPHLLD